MVITWSISEIIGMSLIGLLIVGFILYLVGSILYKAYMRIFKWKYYAEAFDSAPSMLLDRKWGVRYKKHFWNKWKVYKGPYDKYEHDKLKYEAMDLAWDIRFGKIKP